MGTSHSKRAGSQIITRIPEENDANNNKEVKEEEVKNDNSNVEDEMNKQKEVGYIIDMSDTEKEWKEKEAAENANKEKKNEVPESKVEDVPIKQKKKNQYFLYPSQHFHFLSQNFNLFFS